MACSPFREAHLLICTRLGRAEQSRSSSSSRKRCRRRHLHRRRRNNSRRNHPRQQGQGSQEGVEQEGRGRTPCALAGTTCPLAGAVGEGEMAAITDSKGSSVRLGRPRGGQMGEGRAEISSQTPRGSWDFAMHPYPGRCRRPCFHGDNQLSRDEGSAVPSRTFEAESGQPQWRQEEKRS